MQALGVMGLSGARLQVSQASAPHFAPPQYQQLTSLRSGSLGLHAPLRPAQCRAGAALGAAPPSAARRGGGRRGSASPAAASSAAAADAGLPGSTGGPPAHSSGGGGGLQEALHALSARLATWKPPKSLWRTTAALVLGGEALVRILQGKVHWRNTVQQLHLVGPRSLFVCLLTASFVGMVFTIQFIREFAKLGLTRSVGGVLALALARELTPVVTSIIVAGRVGSAFAAELGTMQVSEQTDSLRVLGSDPVDYLITPRVVACMIATPLLNILCFCMGMGASVFLAQSVYGVAPVIILDSARRAVDWWDIVTSMIKCWVFGTVIAVTSCSWGYTTTGGAKGVGESTTSAVVISLVLIFIFDFALSFLFFQGQGDALRSCM